MALLHPESDLTLSVFALGGDILAQIYRLGRPAIVDELMSHHLRRDRRRTAAGFFAALDFLYSVGAIDREGYQVILAPTEPSQLHVTSDA